jgi:hypothetical protein
MRSRRRRNARLPAALRPSATQEGNDHQLIKPETRRRPMKDLSLARIAMPRTARAAMLRRAMLSRYECIFRFGKEPSVARGNCMLRNASLVPTYSNRTEKFVTVRSACVVPSMRRDT